MADITWEPNKKKPSDAAAIEKEIGQAVRGGRVRLTFHETGWRVRALMPAAMCSRGASASDRDVSDKIEDILLDHGCEVERVAT